MKTRNACPIRKYNLQIHVPLPTMLSLSEVFCFATLSVGNLLVTWIGLGFSPMFSGMCMIEYISPREMDVCCKGFGVYKSKQFK